MSQDKKTTLEAIQEFLQKARRRLSDENPDYSDMDEAPDDYGPEFNHDSMDDEFSDDAAADWLRTHDKKNSNDDDGEQEAVKEDEAEIPESDNAESDNAESDNAESETPPVKTAAAPKVQRKPREARQLKVTPSGVTQVREDPLQPTHDELAEIRQYTRPWEQRARDRSKLEAQPHVNPIKHHQGLLVESRHKHHGDRHAAYKAFTESPEYQDADPVTQMEMEADFDKKWHEQNPNHLTEAMKGHGEAHQKGAQAKDLFNAAKDEKIRHIASGGVQPGAYSYEEGLQHAGGVRGDDDEGPQGGITQDKGSQFAVGNREFLDQYMQNYKNRGGSGADLENLPEPRTEDELKRILGNPEALNDPAKKAKFNEFFSRYEPIIEKAKNHVLSKLGLTQQSKTAQIDPQMLNEAGMHAIIQAINDYDPDHPTAAKFTTHLNRKMHGLMQTALRQHQQQDIPDELREGAKKFDQTRRAANAAPVKHYNASMGSIDDPNAWTTVNPSKPAPTPTAAATPPVPKPVGPTVVRRSSHEIAANHPPEVQDRLKRVAAARAPLVRQSGSPAPARKWNVNRISSGEEEE